MKRARELRALGFARIALGLLFLARTTPLLFFVQAPFEAQAFPLLGWPSAAWTVAFPGMALPSAVVASLCVVRTVAALLFTCGVRARLAGVVAAGCGYVVLGQDRFAFITSLHVLFLATFVVALTSATSAVSVVPDRAPAERDVASSVRFVSVVLASIYFWAGAAKVQSEWLSGHALEAEARSGAFAGPLGTWVQLAPVRTLASWTVPGIELAIAVLLVADRRRAAIALGLLFHLVVELTVNPDTLGWQMAVLLLAVWPRRGVTARGALREI